MKSYGLPVIHENGKRAVLYLRVSTEEQVDNFSLKTQEDICRKEAEKRGYEVIDVFREEGRSAKTISGRPILISLIEYCRKNKNKVQAVFVYRLDRISRITADYLAIRKKLAENGITIISSTEPTGDSPTEKLVETMLAGFAQLDNDIRSERARNGLRARFLSGMIVTGQPPLGYLMEGDYAVKDPKRWEYIKNAWDLMETGTKSLKEMTIIMNEWGLRERFRNTENLLRPQRVNEIFRNKFYMGTLTSNTYKEEVKGQHVPMITEDQFYKVQAILDGRNRTKIPLAQRNHINLDFPLRRVVKCARCSIGLTGGWSKGRNAKYAYYWCAGGCKKSSVKVEVLENNLISLLKEISPKKEALDLFTAFLLNTYHKRLSRLQKLKNEAEAEITRLKQQRKVLVEKNMNGLYSDEIFKEQNAIIEDKIIKAQILKEESTIDKYNMYDVVTFLRTKLADLGETYKKSNIAQIKVLLGSMFLYGVSRDNNGTLNHKISPMYQAIRRFSEEDIRSSADERS